MIKIDFSVDTKHGRFSDAIHLPDDHTFTDEQIEAMKQQRVDNWVAYITAPRPSTPVVEEIPIEGEPPPDSETPTE